MSSFRAWSSAPLASLVTTPSAAPISASASPDFAHRAVAGKFDRFSPCGDRVVEAPDAHVHRREHFVAAAVVGIALDMRLDARDHFGERHAAGAFAARLDGRLGDRFRGRTEAVVEAGRQDRGGDEREAQGRCPRVTRSSADLLRGGLFRRGCFQQAARYFNARSLSFILADLAGGAVAFDFRELVAVDGDVAAAALRLGS